MARAKAKKQATKQVSMFHHSMSTLTMACLAVVLLAVSILLLANYQSSNETTVLGTSTSRSR
jgi:hypothetical protein